MIAIAIVLGCLLALIAAALWKIKRQLDAVANRTAEAETRALIGPPHRPGSRFPHFRLRDASGQWRSLDGFGANKIIAIHWNSECEFCRSMTRELQELAPVAQEAGVAIALFARRPENNPEGATVLQCAANTGAHLFRGLGTPSAYWLDRDGYVRRPPATGRDMVLGLIDEAITSSVASARSQ